MIRISNNNEKREGGGRVTYKRIEGEGGRRVCVCDNNICRAGA